GNLESFINKDSELDPLIKMALIHYQFEAIHPFIDGNGRTGRILMLLYLKLSGLLNVPGIYLSEFIMLNKNEYYRRLRAVTENEDWIAWIIFILEMVEWTAKKGIQRLKVITELMDNFTERIRRELPQVYSHELLEILFKLPYTKINIFVEEGLGTRKTVSKYLQALEEKGFLISTKLGKEKLYLNKPLMDILNS
ncbi:MAG: Fic family protein, partial [Bacteroidota bacterium]